MPSGFWATWTLTPIVLALIGIAVADELAIANPGDDVTLGFAILPIAAAPLTLIVGIATSSAVIVAVATTETIGDGDQAPSRSA